MVTFILLTFMAIAFGVGGYAIGSIRNRTDKAVVTRRERRELDSFRTLVSNLSLDLLGYSEAGEKFPLVVADEINQHQKRSNQQ